MSDSYARGDRSVALLEETIGSNLERTVQRYGGREALVSCSQGLRYSYTELDEEVNRLARALIAAGLDKGERVGIWSPNCAEWTLVQYATAKIGVILVNINPAYRTAELQYALAQSGCRMLIAAPAFRTSDYRAMLAEVRDRLPALERAVFLEGPDWEELLAGAAEVGAEELRARSAQLRPEDPINIQYTSGTTGFPKGATLTHRNILNNGFFVGGMCRYTSEDRVCIPVPFYHCFGMVMGNLGATTHGATMVIPAPAFDPEATLSACADERCTSLYGVPTMFIAQLGHPRFAEFDLSSLRTGI
ncbi:MAG TPA: AMP-binding protein, partial [Solirubrobacteraceae bacterium]|nr:AMP-binding protein [Solirubrobacteraceae bacterium]